MHDVMVMCAYVHTHAPWALPSTGTGVSCQFGFKHSVWCASANKMSQEDNCILPDLAMQQLEGWHHYFEDENIQFISCWKYVMYPGMDIDVRDEMPRCSDEGDVMDLNDGAMDRMMAMR